MKMGLLNFRVALLMVLTFFNMNKAIETPKQWSVPATQKIKKSTKCTNRSKKKKRKKK